MSKIEELYKMVNSFPYEKKDDILDALCFFNQPIDDYVLKNYLDLKDLEKKHMQFDAFSGTYKRKSISDYEDKWKRALMRISSTESIVENLAFVVSEMTEIKEGIHGIHYNEMFKSCCEVTFMIEVCKNMMLQGATLTEISKYVPGTQIGDIYHLAVDHLGIKLELNDDELEEIRKYDENLQTGRIQKTNVQDIMVYRFFDGIPHKSVNEGKWSLNGEIEYDTRTMASMYSECEISYPYYYEDRKSPKYANTLDELLEVIMLYADKVSLEGLEKAYSLQEWNLINRLQKKILEKLKIEK